jgi:hypothetical protein
MFKRVGPVPDPKQIGPDPQQYVLYKLLKIPWESIIILGMFILTL